MKQLVINVKDSKLQFFLELIKNFDFISVEDRDDWYNELSDKQREAIQKGIADLDAGNTRTHAEVMEAAKAKIQSFKDR